MKHYTFIDYATQGYMAIVGLLIWVFHGQTVARWPSLVGAHAMAIIVVHWLVQANARFQNVDSKRKSAKVINFLRHFYPVLLYIGFYRETGELNHMFVPNFLDPLFIRLDERIFGGQPSLTLMSRLPYLPVSEVMYAAYFSYYVMIFGVGLALFTRQRHQFFHYLSVISFVFYVCYLIYTFAPVIGPRVFDRRIASYALPAEVQPDVVPEIPAALQAGPFFRIMAVLYDVFEAPGAAFPSSHVAVALATLYFTFRYLPRIRVIHAIVVVLLCVATIYCRYHYAVDVIAGIATAVVLVPLGNWLYFRFGRRLEA